MVFGDVEVTTLESFAVAVKCIDFLFFENKIEKLSLQ